jgi:hypothetical protein
MLNDSLTCGREETKDYSCMQVDEGAIGQLDSPVAMPREKKPRRKGEPRRDDADPGAEEAGRKARVTSIAAAVVMAGGPGVVAKKLGVSRQALHKWMRLGPEGVKLDRLRQIAEATKQPLESFIKDLQRPGNGRRKY